MSSHFRAARPAGARACRFPLLAFAWALLLPLACDRLAPHDHEHGDGHDHDHDHAEGHDHGDEAPTRQWTLVDHGVELFVEHPLPVVGEAVRFVVHVTDIASGAPRTTGAATLALQRDGSPPVSVRVDAPARAGIYLPELTLPAAGEWRATFTLANAGGDVALALPAIKAYADDEAAHHAELPAPPEGIAFLKEQQWRLKTRIAAVGRQRLVEELRVAGFVDASPAARAHVTAPLAGRLVAAERPWPKLGDEVKRGDVLAGVEPQLAELIVAQAQAQAEVAQARLAVEQADLAAARTRTLHEQQARSARELEEAEFAAKGARARLAAAEAIVAAWRQTGLVPAVAGEQLLLPRLALTAPIDGVVVAVHAVAGEHAADDRPLFELLDPSVPHIEARVPEIDLPRLADELEAAYSLPGHDAPPVPITGSGGGRLAWRGVEIDPATRTGLLHFSLPDPQRRLRLGQALVVHLATRVAQDALALPEEAIVDEDGHPVVFVQVGGESFERRDVTLGIRDRGRIEIAAGLAEGERVVVAGAYAVRLASMSAAIPAHSHEH